MGMTMIRRLMVQMMVTAAASAAFAASAAGQSFDCRRAVFPDERAICRSSQLSKLDGELAALFGRAIRAVPSAQRAALTRRETEWVVARRHCGRDDGCIEQHYRDRMAALASVLGGGDNNIRSEQPDGQAHQTRPSAVTAGVGGSTPTGANPRAAGSDQPPAAGVTVQFR